MFKVGKSDPRTKSFFIVLLPFVFTLSSTFPLDFFLDITIVKILLENFWKTKINVVTIRNNAKEKHSGHQLKTNKQRVPK